VPIIVVTDKELTEDDRSKLQNSIQAICRKSSMRPGQLLEEIKRQVARKIKTGTAKMNNSVLLADDVQENRMLLEIILKRAGFKVTGVENGQKALESARKEKFDLILMDIQMPVMDGIEATRIIHAEQTDLCIIGLSMFEEDDRACAMIQAGAANYLTKSGRPEVLLSAIRRHKEQRG
jgi:CheY-like chemotaxis protein